MGRTYGTTNSRLYQYPGFHRPVRIRHPGLIQDDLWNLASGIRHLASRIPNLTSRIPHRHSRITYPASFRREFHFQSRCSLKP